MGFKSVDLQVAIPRTQDASKMQEQLTRQGQQFQDSLTQQQLREEMLKRTQVNEYEDVKGQILDDESQEKEQEKAEEQVKKLKQEEKAIIDHPYLGKHIDYSR